MLKFNLKKCYNVVGHTNNRFYRPLNFENDTSNGNNPLKKYELSVERMNLLNSLETSKNLLNNLEKSLNNFDKNLLHYLLNNQKNDENENTSNKDN